MEVTIILIIAALFIYAALTGSNNDLNQKKMKKYVIFKFEDAGIFICNEQLQEDGSVFLIGTFENLKTKLTFIKQIDDKLIN